MIDYSKMSAAEAARSIVDRLFDGLAYQDVVRVTSSMFVLAVINEQRQAATKNYRKLYSIENYHEDFGPVLCWRIPVEEAPKVAQPRIDCDWGEADDNWYTHFQKIFVPKEDV